MQCVADLLPHMRPYSLDRNPEIGWNHDRRRVPFLASREWKWTLTRVGRFVEYLLGLRSVYVKLPEAHQQNFGSSPNDPLRAGIDQKKFDGIPISAFSACNWVPRGLDFCYNFLWSFKYQVMLPSSSFTVCYGIDIAHLQMINMMVCQ